MRSIYKNVICKNNKKVKYISEMWDCIYLNLIQQTQFSDVHNIFSYVCKWIVIVLQKLDLLKYQIK